MDRCEVIRRRGYLAAALLVVACLRRDHRTVVPSSETAEAPVRTPTYEVHLKTPQPIRAGVPVHLALSVVTSNGITPALEETYNASLHLVAVSRDLRWYAHLHSQTPAASDVRFELTFPADGEYVLFAYFTPANGEVQSDRVPLVVGNPRQKEPQHALRPSPFVREIRGYRVELLPAALPIRTNEWQSLTFRMERDRKPIANLGSEGDLSHLAIIREGAEDFVVAHSSVEEAGGVRSGMHVPSHPALPDEAIHELRPVGPEVTFHARFPRAGRYKLWVEFRPAKERIAADFVVNVKE